MSHKVTVDFEGLTIQIQSQCETAAHSLCKIDKVLDRIHETASKLETSKVKEYEAYLLKSKDQIQKLINEFNASLEEYKALKKQSFDMDVRYGGADSKALAEKYNQLNTTLRMQGENLVRTVNELTGSKLMDSKEYFENYKDKIKETAEFLCSKDPSKNLEDEFEKLKQQYLNCDGTCHNETISINSQDLNIHPWLEMIRHEPVENFVIIAVGGKQSEIIYKTKGDQCSNYNLSDKAIRDSIGVCILKGIKNLGLFVFHNHPYIYKALPSSSDLDTLEAIKDAINDIENNSKDMNINCSITLLDFSIVTDFDYWSAIQSC